MMGAVTKAIIPQSTLGPTRPEAGTDLCLDDLLAQTRSVELKEIRQLSGFVPLLVFIPESNAKGQAIQRKMAGDKTPGESRHPAKLLSIFGNAREQWKTRNAESEFVFGEITVNFREMEVCRQGQPVVLTCMEFKALKYLVRNARRVIARDELLNEVWGYENYPCTRTVDNHIFKLRQKLEKHPDRPVHFRTVYRAGYKFLP